MLKLNLINEKEFIKAITALLYNDVEVFTLENLKDIDFVINHKNAIISSLILQCLKKRCREYFATEIDKNEQKLPFKNVEIKDDLPDWAKNNLANSIPVMEFTNESFPAKTIDDLTKARDFLYQKALEIIDRQIASYRNNGKPVINLSALFSQYNSFDEILKGADRWHKEIEEKSKINMDPDLEKSLEGTAFLMDLPNGLKAYQLLTPEALDYESNKMGHCVGSGSYDAKVASGSVNIYSIRDSKGEPHVTFETRIIDGNEEMYQCKGRANKAPANKYVSAVQEFIKKKEFILTADIANTRMILINGQYYSIDDIPENIIVEGDLTVSNYGLEELPECFKNMVVKGNFNCSANNLITLKNMPKVLGSIDCSQNELCSLEGAPQEINGSFICRDNPHLKSLKGAPEIVKNKTDYKGCSYVFFYNRKFVGLDDLEPNVVVEGDLSIKNSGLKTIPPIFSTYTVTGNFDCSRNMLKTLKNMPKVLGSIDCSQNEICSLGGVPEIIYGDFDCSYNELTNLEGGPRIVKGSFDCQGQGWDGYIGKSLKSLSGAPEFVKKDFNCSENSCLHSLKDGPKEVCGVYNCSQTGIQNFVGMGKAHSVDAWKVRFLYTLEGLPPQLEGDLNIEDCRFLKSLEFSCLVKGAVTINGKNIKGPKENKQSQIQLCVSLINNENA